MNREPTQAQRRRLRELCGLAYERDLGAELAKLEADFARWRIGAIDAFELSDLVHEFHQGAARKLFLRHDHLDADIAVADAIHREVLTADEAGAEILVLLESKLAFLRGG